MLIEILISFIGASLLLYVVLGGPDYGAGILELLPAGRLREPQKHAVNNAMGPVWEANHMWLILIVVILFVGFPTIFTTLMVWLHVPMLALLGGIVARGSAFTFRHYDAIQEPRSQKIYTWIFGLSSLWTTFWLGIIVASLNRGIIDPNAADLWSAYFAPWWGLYPVAVGCFAVCIFAFLASVYLIGETDKRDLQRRFTRFAAIFNGLVVVTGGLVFAASMRERRNLFEMFTQHPLALVVMAIATALFVAMWWFINRQRIYLMRTIAAGQVTLILAGWLLLYAPNALLTLDGPLSFHDAAAPPATLRQLVIALLVGSVLIFPSLFYLLRVFKARPGSRPIEQPDRHA
jgi:cytochrome d ubiquinol oxidase subunit II